MNRYKILAIILIIIGLILSHIMCAHVAFEYCNMLWGIKCAGYSAPANVAFLFIIPYMLCIIIVFVIALIFLKKSKKGK